jgi:hypothetical protein
MSKRIDVGEFISFSGIPLLLGALGAAVVYDPTDVRNSVGVLLIGIGGYFVLGKFLNPGRKKYIPKAKKGAPQLVTLVPATQAAQ